MIAALASPDARGQCWKGAWEAPFDDTGAGTTPADAGTPARGWTYLGYKFNAIHASLIPKGPHQGHVMVFDHIFYTGHPSNEQRICRYMIVDPVSKQFWRHILLLPDKQGDLFCAGHAWTKDGNLLIAGGTGCHGQRATTPPCPGWEGAKLAYLWAPPATTGQGGTWFRVTDMAFERWYPSVIAMDSLGSLDPMVVPGGTHVGNAVNSYHVWQDTPTQPNGGTWELGPTFAGPGNTVLGDYPRMHWLSTGDAALGGMLQHTNRVRHFASPGVWLTGAELPWAMQNIRGYGTSVLFPISPGGALKDYVMSIGGLDWNTYTILGTWEISLASASGLVKNWTAGMAGLAHPRWLCNGVLLPDTKILLIAGEKYSTTNGCAMVPALEPELFDPATLTWVTLAAGTIIRDYHNTALLLPSGKVWTAGGEARRFQVIPPPSPPVCLNTPLPSGAQADFQLFVPHYLNCGNVQPVILNPPSHGAEWTWARVSTQLVQHQAFPEGTLLSIDKVVLTRAGSVTHHSDGNQRCVQLDFTVVPGVTPPTLQVTVPSANLGILPRGYYMLWLVTNQGTPSQAAWVKVTG